MHPPKFYFVGFYLTTIFVSKCLAEDVNSVQKTVAKVLAIGQTGQLCSNELTRLEADRSRTIKQDRDDIARAAGLSDGLRKISGRKPTPEELRVAALINEINSRFKRVNGQPGSSPADKELAKLNMQIDSQQRCVEKAFKLPAAYTDVAK